MMKLFHGKLASGLLLLSSTKAWVSRRSFLLSPSVLMSAYSSSTNASFKLESPAFENGGAIPSVYTRCDGDDISPELKWSGLPQGSKSLALIVDDPDAPDPKAPKMTWVHWVVYNIPPEESGLPKGVKQLPAGAKEGKNDWKETGYGGPAPPIGTHRYFHKLYALDTKVPDLGQAADKKSLEKAMQGHILAQAELMGTYKKS